MGRIKAVLIILLCFAVAVALPLTSYALTNFWKVSLEVIDTDSRVTLSAFFERGTGTSQDPYIIHQPRHMANLSKLVAVGYLMNPYFYEICTGCEIGTVSVINMEGYPTAPIGSAEYPFTGHFNGRGRTVSNAMVVSGKPDGINEYDDLGFFGFVGPGASVRDLILDNPRIVSGIYPERGVLDSLDPASNYSITHNTANNTIVLNGNSVGNEFYTLHSSDRFNFQIDISPSGVYSATPATHAQGRVFLHVNVNIVEASGLTISKALGGYLVDIAGMQIIEYRQYTNILRRDGYKHVGLAVGHVAGSVEDISVYGGSIETDYYEQSASFKNHTSMFGTIGFVDTFLVSIGFLNGDSEYIEAGDVGYLHPDGLNTRIGTPTRYYENGMQDTNYLTSGGFATVRAGGGWNFQSNRNLPGFGVFRLITDDGTGNITRTEPIGTTVTQFHYFHTPVAGSSPLRYGDYANPQTTGTLFDLAQDYASNPHLVPANEDNIMRNLRTNIIDPFKGGTQRIIRGFDYGLRFGAPVQNNPQNFFHAHQYTGAQGAQSSGVIGASVHFETTRPNAKIIVIGRNALPSQGTAQIILARLFYQGNRWQDEPIQVLHLPTNQTSAGCVFEVPTAGMYAIQTKTNSGQHSGVQGNANAQILYVAVEGQTEGESGGIDAGTVSTVDFVYKDAQGHIVPVNAGGYVWTELSLKFDWVIDGRKAYFRRNSSAIHVNVYYNGDSSDFTKESASGSHTVHSGEPPP
ncbi:MAG: hypothetical protein FWD49_03210 [Firmicutes bacterium]|nr:hypothetical protein [Bacillota bacterium]